MKKAPEEVLNLAQTAPDSFRCLAVDIYRTGLIDCTNRGATSIARNPEQRALLICPDGPWGSSNAVDVENPNRGTPVFLVQTKLVGGEEFRYAVEVDPHTGEIVRPDNAAGPMMGGNFLHTCDSRFRHWFGEYPLAVHDRFET